MERVSILNELSELIDEGEKKILTSKGAINGQYVIGVVDSTLYAGWRAKALAFLHLILPQNDVFIRDFAKYEKYYYDNAKSSIAVLKSVLEYGKKGFLVLNDGIAHDPIKDAKRVFTRFHKVAVQMRRRHDNRPTIEMTDEYDVQDLLYALLKMFFDDVRAEECTPSYAGKASRMDFLLKKEKVVIEVKKTRKGLEDKELGDQLIIDVERYKTHPDCEKLICFVYDPESRIVNPSGLANDLNELHQGFVEVVIEPA